MPPAYRNPNNDLPKIGEDIHFYGGHYEAPGIVSRKPMDNKFPATIFREAGPEVRWLSLDDYDPTEDPALYSWHFHHLS